MIKLVDPGAFGFAEPVARLVKVSSRGLRGGDLGQFLKRAGHDFAAAVGEARPGEVPVHMLAIGAYEYYGSNRNGDGFDEADCAAHHDSFRKLGHYFRNHANKPTDLRYGRIIKSAYHAPMHRTELLIGLYADEAAARRGGGELGRVADRELEKVARGDDFAVSMGCKVAHDVCSECANRAREKDEYCDTVPVRYRGRTVPPCSGFGAAHGLTKVSDSGRVQHVKNPRPGFFDISGVDRGADRTAFCLGHAKAASLAPAIGSAALAALMGLSPPPGLDDAPLPAPAAVLRKLSLCDRMAAEERRGDPTLDAAVGTGKIAAFPADEPARVLRALADACVPLGVHDWLHLLRGKEAADAAAAQVEAALPGAFGRLAASPALPALLAEAPYDAAPACSTKLAAWAEGLAAAHGLRRGDVAARAERAAIRGAAAPAARPKLAAAAATPGAEALAAQYALYQLAFLEDAGARNGDDPLTRTLLARKNVLA